VTAGPDLSLRQLPWSAAVGRWIPQMVPRPAVIVGSQ
jgi:hypothetical protein